MKFTTIWTIPAMSFTERLKRTRDFAAMKVAAKLPHCIRYWTFIQVAGKATVDSPNVPATTLDEIMRKVPLPRS